MRTITFLALLTLLFSCTSEQKNDSKSTDTEVVSNFLNDIESLKSVKDPINNFILVANNRAIKKVELTKDNASDVLSDLSNYKTCVIVVENHTIVTFNTLEDCKQSTSWNACMPKGKGFVKKGDLVEQDDFINNIIGIPDNQNRTAYFFE